MTPIHGSCDARFSAVREAFIDNFEQRGDVGASTALMYDGKLVVDLWGGYLDADHSREWPRDGLVNVWSLGKAMSALCLLTAYSAGDLDVADPVTKFWPEFGAAGKTAVTIEMLLAHQAGLPGIAAPLPNDALFRWDVMATALAEQAPWWEPGTAHGYHSNTYGYLAGEVIRRVYGTPIREYFQHKIALPMKVDFHMGIGANQSKRIADLVYSEPPAAFVERSAKTAEAPNPALEAMRNAISRTPGMDQDIVNTARWRAAEFPSTNPQSNARSVATIFGAMANVLNGAPHPNLPARAIIEDAIIPRSDGLDLVLNRPTKFGLGLQLSQPDRPLGISARAFGHYGNGGHLGFGDPEHNLGFAYDMNHQGWAWRDPRNIALVDAVYASL